MVLFPYSLVAIAYPGYFWHVEEQRLYSIKIGGELKQLRYSTPNKWNHWTPSYRISHHGQSRILPIANLKDLELSDNVMPIHGRKNPLTEEQITHVIKDIILIRSKVYFKPTKISTILNIFKRDFEDRYAAETVAKLAEQQLEN